MQIFFENPTDVLSQLIRTAFVAEEGSRFIVADFSAIEARVLAWFADEKWRMEVFANGGDIYCASASSMFHVPVEKHGVNKELRAKGKVAELACGYGGGVGALKAMGADKMGLSDADMESIIKKWRKANPKINNLWYAVENCATYAVRNKTFKHCRKGVAFHCVDDYLFVYLPSGRKISYFKPKLVKDSNGKETLTYEGTTQSNNGWGVQRTWGGKIVENIVQAIARDCLATAMLNLNYFGYKIVMHVHDEVILEVPKARADEIKLWMANFTDTLRSIFDNSDLNVVFDIEKMTFYIDEPGKKPFTFDELASGYAAILDIITDLTMRMEKKVGTKYDMPGFVLIDEVDAHLHLSLQKNILPTLTTLFPNTQFIVTTHSPFVLNSIANAVVYNIETNTLVNTPEGLSKLPYSGIVEGYFGVSELSFKLKKKFCVKNMK